MSSDLHNLKTAEFDPAVQDLYQRYKDARDDVRKAVRAFGRGEITFDELQAERDKAQAVRQEYKQMLSDAAS
jgi:hypothetical protein